MPDGLYISFEDSVHGGGYGTYNAARVERYCGGVPEPYRSCLDITHDGESVTAALSSEFTLPSHLLHDNRKAVLRGMAVLFPPLFTIIIFAWVGSTFRSPPG